MKDFFRDDLIYKESLPNHKKNIPTIILSEVWTSISDLPNLKIFVQILFLEKNTLTTFDWDICPISFSSNALFSINFVLVHPLTHPPTTRLEVRSF